MKVAVVALSVALPLAAACVNEQRVTAVNRHLATDFSDGRVAGANPHFFFLPPLVSQPTFSGVFNSHIQPVVDICQLDETLSPVDCAAGVTHINPGAVQVDSPDHYHVDWQTDQPPIDVTKFYRIQVFGSTGGLRLGFADVQPVGSGGQMKKVDTGEFIGLVDGRTLPIQFRIENGAFLPDFNCTDCAEQTITNAGGTVVTSTGFAGAQFPAGWLTSPSSVVVTIERETVDNGVFTSSCVQPVGATPFVTQFEGCYQFKTSPRATFATNVVVGVCPSFSVPAVQHDVIQLYSFDTTADGGFVTRALPNVPAPFVTCTGFASARPPRGWLPDLAARVLHQVGSFFTPTTASAAHLGSGGSTCCFSRIGWAMPVGTLINPDAAPGGAAIAPGTAINGTYSTLGVTFSRTMPGAFCGVETTVYANDNGPLEGGGFGFGSGDNVITICPEGIASDFNEQAAGRIIASFSGTVTQACIQAYVTGPAGGHAVLEAFNGDGGSLVADTSAANAFGENLCVSAAGIASVRFAGLNNGFAMFDNLIVQFPTLQ